MLRSLLDWPRSLKRTTVMALDVCLCLLAMWLAFSLRLETLHQPQGMQWLVYVLAPALALAIFLRLGLYRAIFRHTGIESLVATAGAGAIYGLVLEIILFSLQSRGLDHMMPRSIGLLQPLIFLLLVVTSRAMARSWLGGSGPGNKTPKARLLIYGAGEAGVQTAAGIGASGPFMVAGFVDDDTAKIGRSINHLRVYPPQAIAELVETQGITDILLAMPSVSRERRNAIIQRLNSVPVHVRTLPGLSDLANGRVSTQDIRELDIEDLLGREPVAPNPDLLARNLTGKTVLVTGAGGSIGSELCRQITLEKPLQLILLDHSEYALYAIHEALLRLCASRGLQIQLIPLLGSITNVTRINEILERYRPQTVYHAAAYKHVPMVESNVAEGVQNNVFGTLNLALAAQSIGSAHFVLISTDKAVRPTNVMGATKRVSELILQALAAQTTPCRTRFSMVRFGNVLGSSGSVVPEFRRQLADGGPLRVTHPEITRYFMTIPEAAQLVLQAGAMSVGGEVFILEMGQPVRIIDLARRIITLSGLRVREHGHDGDVEIAISGLRPGEKLYEELLTGNNPSPTAHARIMKAREGFMPWDTLIQRLDELQSTIQTQDVSQIVDLLKQLVPEYTPSSHLSDVAGRLSQTVSSTAEVTC
ncbi:MAG: polysaccharide biosynthesis protein [Betaproteobacteria bacterium]|nr:polysaccharide biosynthesis protein [Betaproteobacteria bacterium]